YYYLIDLIKKHHNVYEVSYVIKKEKGYLRSKFSMLKRAITNLLYARKII
ncbi:protease SohB, partial [Francisella tularensis subsp. holarctica]|nr:protease SohB [Francisella tularensis subsp. holarctica]